MKKRLTTYAKRLRKNPTEVEKALWSKLRYKQMGGHKFRRQQPIGPYIVDFVNFEKKLIVELDGGQHAENREKDLKRDEFLRLQGVTVLRFWNNEIFQNLEGVLQIVQKKLESPARSLSEKPTPTWPPPSRGRKL